MPDYKEAVATLQQQLDSAKRALPRDVAAAVASRDWSDVLRDRFDVEALIDHIDQRVKDSAFIKQVQAVADKERSQQRQRGRPRKQAGAKAEPTAPSKPLQNFIRRAVPKPTTEATNATAAS